MAPEDTHEEENGAYDAQLIAVVDDDIITANAPALFNDKVLLARDGEKMQKIPGAMEQLFGERDSIAPWRRELAEEIAHPIDVESVQFLANSKVRLNLLIDTRGGTNLVLDFYRKLVDLVKKNGGKVDAYIGIQASSAGQILACAADERFCVEKSRMMFHMPQFDPDRMKNSTDPGYWKQRVPQVTREAFDQVSKQLLALASANGRRMIRTKLRNACIDEGNEDNAVHIFGPELDEFGIVTRSFESVDEMRDEFESRTGLAIEEGPDNPVSRFFDQARRGKHGSPTLRVV